MLRRLSVVLVAVVAGCATNPYAMRDYAAVIEQARKVGAGEPHRPATARAPEKATTPCPMDGLPAGADAGAAGPEGTGASALPSHCRTPDDRAGRVTP